MNNTNELRVLLARAGLNVPALASKLGVSHQAVYLWLNNKSKPDLKRLKKLAKLLDIDVEILMKIWYNRDID